MIFFLLSGVMGLCFLINFMFFLLNLHFWSSASGSSLDCVNFNLIGIDFYRDFSYVIKVVLVYTYSLTSCDFSCYIWKKLDLEHHFPSILRKYERIPENSCLLMVFSNLASKLMVIYALQFPKYTVIKLLLFQKFEKY